MSLKIDSNTISDKRKSALEKTPDFDDLSTLIEKIDTLDEPSDSLKGKFIEHLKFLKKTKEGEKLFALLKASHLPIAVNLNEDSINLAEGSRIAIDPSNPNPVIVAKDGHRYLEKNPIPVVIFHELRHVLNYINDTIEAHIVNFEEVVEYDNLEEFHVINGKTADDLSENSLRKELGLAQRVSHKSTILQSVIDPQYLTRLAEINLMGNLLGLIPKNIVRPDQLMNSNVLDICIKKNNTPVMDCITDRLLSYGEQYKDWLLEQAIASQSSKFLTHLNKKEISIETDIGILPAKKPIIYFLEETSLDNEDFLAVLLSLNPQLDILNNNKKTILEIAFEKDLNSCFNLLIKHNPDLINMKNAQEKTIQQVIEESSAENRHDFLVMIKSATLNKTSLLDETPEASQTSVLLPENLSPNSPSSPESVEEQIPDIEDYM